MKDSFISRNMLIRVGEEYRKTVIRIEKPVARNDGDYNARVIFSDIGKYDANIRGADSFNAVESAISYINSVCRDSADPRFYWDEDSPFFGSG